jgi:hypothetical protein
MSNEMHPTDEVGRLNSSAHLYADTVRVDELDAKATHDVQAHVGKQRFALTRAPCNDSEPPASASARSRSCSSGRWPTKNMHHASVLEVVSCAANSSVLASLTICASSMAHGLLASSGSTISAICAIKSSAAAASAPLERASRRRVRRARRKTRASGQCAASAPASAPQEGLSAKNAMLSRTSAQLVSSWRPKTARMMMASVALAVLATQSSSIK